MDDYIGGMESSSVMWVVGVVVILLIVYYLYSMKSSSSEGFQFKYFNPSGSGYESYTMSKDVGPNDLVKMLYPIA